MWDEVAEGYWRKAQFPNCIGAIDGKHVTIQPPPLSGSQYLHFNSIVLFALVDAYCRFRAIQVGDFGRTSGGGVYANSDLGRGMESKSLHVPSSVSLPGAAQLGDVPFVMVGDTAFPMKPYLVRPYPGQNLTHPKKVYNYRLSRARRAVENAFRILAARWRIFHRKINLHPNKVDNVLIAACILHNFLLNPTDSQRYVNESEQQGRTMATVSNMGGNRASKEAHQVREVFCHFFSSPEGSVHWQDRMV